MLHTKLQSNNCQETRGNIVKAVNGTIALEEIINSIILENYTETEEEKNIKEKIFLRIEKISEKYLTNAEKMIYNLYVKDNKTVADIEKIMGFGCWYTSEKHILKTFKILKIYYDYHLLDLKELKGILKKEFTDYEREVLKRLHNRKTYSQITGEIGGYYRKIYYDCIEIFSKLESINDTTRGYATFLKEIRRFKRKE